MGSMGGERETEWACDMCEEWGKRERDKEWECDKWEEWNKRETSAFSKKRTSP